MRALLSVPRFPYMLGRHARARFASVRTAALKTSVGIAVCVCTALTSAQTVALSPELEARANKLAEHLRCLVCQNQSIAESNADLANDLKRQVREQLQAGKSEDEIVDYMVARYGDFVLYQPPVKPATWLLWGGPALLLFAAFAAFAATIRSRKRQAQPALSAEEHARAEALLAGNSPDGERRT